MLHGSVVNILYIWLRSLVLSMLIFGYDLANKDRIFVDPAFAQIIRFTQNFMFALHTHQRTLQKLPKPFIHVTTVTHMVTGIVFLSPQLIKVMFVAL
jgi:hypothetical protein